MFHGHGPHGPQHRHNEDQERGRRDGGYRGEGRGGGRRGPFGGPPGGFPGFGFGGFSEEGGRFGGRRPPIERGMLRYLLLDTLNDQPKHGYEIIKAFEERTGGQYAPSPGTVYPMLQLLDDQGMIRAEEGSDRRTYRLTESGQTELTAHRSTVDEFWARYAEGSAPGFNRHEARFLAEETKDLMGTVWSGAKYAMGRGDTETMRRIRAAVERCKSEVRDIVAAAPTTPPIPDDATTTTV